MRILVTGAAGFIGQHLCAALLTAGHQVIGTWNRNPPSAIEIKNGTDTVQFAHIEWHQWDWAIGLPDESFPSVDVVIHLAAALPSRDGSSLSVSLKNKCINTNVLAYVLQHQTRLIFASSAAVYAPSNEILDESTSLITQEPYGLEKYMFEQQAQHILEQNDLPFLSLRLSSPYGPRQTLSTVLPLFIKRALSAEPLVYHGTGNRAQDFIYISDVVDCICLMLTGPSGIYNVASGTPIKMKELAYLIANLLDSKPAVLPSGQPDPQEGYLPRYSLLNIQKALKWNPKVTLVDGIDSIIAYEQRVSGL